MSVISIIGRYNPSVRIIDIVLHTTYVVCANFTHKWRDLQLKVDSERNFSWQFYLLLKVFAKNLLKENRRRNIFIFNFVLTSGLGGSNPGFTSTKPTHYLLEYGDFGECLCLSINVNKLFTFFVFVYFVYVCVCSDVVVCLLIYSCFSFTDDFYLFVDHVNMSNVLFFMLLFIILITPFPFS